MKLNQRMIHIVVAFISFVTICFSMFFSGYSLRVHAEELDVRSAFEERNVLNDLQDSTRDGVPFAPEKYGFKSNGTTQLFSFVEFCYSFHENMQSNYGLYVYVYNQKGFRFNIESDLNKISLCVVSNEVSYNDRDKEGQIDRHYRKYCLEFLNMSEKQDYEGLFYKFKISLTENQKQTILDEVNGSKRIYRVGDIELVKANNDVESIKVGMEFRFSGYAQGFGANSEAESTLKMNYEETDIISLNPEAVFYRPDGTNGKNDYTQDSLHSVYFAVPNYFIRKYGELVAVHAVWLQAVLKPMLVTGNQEAYSAILPYLGKVLDYPNELNLWYLGIVGSHRVGDKVVSDYGYAYNKLDISLVGYSNFAMKFSVPHGQIDPLYFMFNSGSWLNSADSYVVDSEMIREKMLESAQKFGGELVNGKYSKAIFESVDDDFFEVDGKGTFDEPLTSVIKDSTAWEKYFGKKHEVLHWVSPEFRAIYPIEEKDFLGTDKEIGDRLYVQEKFIPALKKYYKQSDNADSTVYLFRYRKSEYFAEEATLYKSEKYGLSQMHYKEVDSNAYFFQESVDLDFDIIDLTFSNGEKETVIPVGMVPMDIIHDGTPPVYTTKDGLPWWKILFGILAVVVFMLLLWKFAPWIILGLLKLVFLPFRLIAYPFKKAKRTKYHKRE